MKRILGSKEFAWAKIVGKFGGVQVIVQFFGFCSGLLLVRALSKDVYALYTFANVMLGAMSILADSGVGSGAMAMAGRVWNDKIKLNQVVSTAIHLRRFFCICCFTMLIACPFSLAQITRSRRWIGARGCTHHCSNSLLELR